MSELEKILAKWRNEDWTELEAFSRATYVSEAPVVVIGGCARSGTTLLRVMLDSHSAVTCGVPSNVFVPTAIDAKELAFRFEFSEHLVWQMQQASADRAEFIDKFRMLCEASTGKAIWGDKTARNVHQFKWIRQHFPKALLIHVIRDARDTACSLRTHRKRRVIGSTIELTGNVLPLNECVQRWVRDVNVGIAMRGDPRYIEVKYEDVVRDSEAVLRVVCEKIGITFEKQMLDYYMVSGPSRDVLKFPQNIEATKPMYSTSVGRWRRDLTPEELSTVLHDATPLLELLGYAPYDSGKETQDQA